MTKEREALKLARDFISAEWGFGGTTDIEPSKLVRMLDEALAEQPAIKQDLTPEQPAQQQEQKLEFVLPGGGYVPAIPRPLPLDWKLVPRKATPEMLRAMDECAQEGYDERLYAGMASSVYMAAWDASPVMGTLPEQPAQRKPLHIGDESAAFKAWFDAWWVGDGEQGETIPTQSDKHFLTYLDQYTLGFGAWMAAKHAAHGITGEQK